MISLNRLPVPGIQGVIRSLHQAHITLPDDRYDSPGIALPMASPVTNA